MKYSSDIYEKLLNQENEESCDSIKKDLHRTILITDDNDLKDSLKNKQNKLFNILKAYSNYDREVNYVQGSNYIVNVLLSNLNSERASFWMFLQIMEDKNWRDLYVNNLPKLQRLLDLLRVNMERKVPNILNYISNEIEDNIFSAIFSSYFITIFSYNVPLDYANRVFDFFWLKEENIIIDCLIHLLKLNENKIIKMPMEELVPYIRSELVNDSINNFGIENALPNFNYIM